MESTLFQILSDIFAPFLLAFSISFGALRKGFDEKTAVLIAFVFAMLFLYYQNTRPQIFSSFVVYTLITMVILLMGTTIILGKKLTPKIAVGIFFITIFAMALYTIVPVQIEEETFTNIEIKISAIDIIILGFLFMMIGIMYSLYKRKKEEKEKQLTKKYINFLAKFFKNFLCRNDERKT